MRATTVGPAVLFCFCAGIFLCAACPVFAARVECAAGYISDGRSVSDIKLEHIAGDSSPPAGGELRREILRAAQGKKAQVGVAVYGLEDGFRLGVNETTRFPMQSVFKFHIALTVLRAVDAGKFRLDQNIYVAKRDLLPNTWSPIRDKYPEGNVSLPLSEILRHTVAQSDNNGCDILLRLLGGPKAVEDGMRAMGVGGVAVKHTEKDMHRDWNAQFANWTTPESAVDALAAFYGKRMLSEASFAFLWKTMTETSTGPGRIRGKLPEGTVVAHKTGTSGTNARGVTAAVNDIGIVTLPDGRHFAIAVFVADSRESMATNEAIIADIAGLVWDHFAGQGRAAS